MRTVTYPKKNLVLYSFENRNHKRILTWHRFLQFHFSIFFFLLVSIEKIHVYQTLKKEIDHKATFWDLDTKKTATQILYRSLPWKLRSHVRILIYRTWPIPNSSKFVKSMRTPLSVVFLGVWKCDQNTVFYVWVNTKSFHVLQSRHE